MGKADVFESDYLENAEIFADLVNGVLYDGRQVVKPEELSEQDGELRSVAGSGVRKAIRDKVRLWKGTLLAVFAVENQTKVDYHMVIRAMLSESMAYDRQWKKLKNDLTSENKKLDSEELLSGMRREDRFIPVITIVIYYGRDKSWDGAKTLYELLDVKERSEEILPFISDYRLNIFDYHDYEEFGQFRTEWQFLFEFLRYSNDRKKLKEKLEEHKEQYGRLSSQAKVLLMQLANIKKIPDIKEEEFARGEFDMCKAFEDMRAEGKAEGKAEGIIEMGQEFGLSDIEIIKILENKLGISTGEAKEYCRSFLSPPDSDTPKG